MNIVQAGSPFSRENAAITIQKHIRGREVRKSFLPRSIPFNVYSQLCRHALYTSDMPQAENGISPVYFPPSDSRIILKHCGRAKAIKRFEKMQMVRKVLKEQGSQHLVIPRARLCGDFLVEERLSINVDEFHNMALYSENAELFDEAVKEITRLFSKIVIEDLVNRSGFMSSLVDDIVRYDNMPLYLEQDGLEVKGKIGLIDLERISLEPQLKDIQTVTRIFPYHLDIIETESGRELDFNLEVDKGIQYLQEGYLDFRDWLGRKSIDPKSAVATLKKPCLKGVIEVLTLELLRLNEGNKSKYSRRFEPYPKSLKRAADQCPKKIAGYLAKYFFEHLSKSIVNYQKRHCQKRGPITSDPEMVSVRTPWITKPDKNKIWNKIGNFFSLARGGENISEQLHNAFLRQLQGEGVIYFYESFLDKGHYVVRY